MKILNFLIPIVLLIGIVSCDENDAPTYNDGITFRQLDFDAETDENGSNALVEYDEIIGYDSTQYAFLINESAWERINAQITPVYPDPNFVFGVALNQELLYNVTFIPAYHSSSYFDVVTFRLQEPNRIYLELGYPASPNLFTGEDHRNDLQLINYLKEDNKLIELE